MKRILGLIILFPMLICAQGLTNFASSDSLADGIRFLNGMNWREVVSMAKTQHKYIFIDCYTTWCGPCKEMERNVYPLARVGAVYNEEFISIKMQMDTSKNDNDLVKNLYGDAHYLRTKFNVDGYPTFLFFTPDGKILDKRTGLESPEDFIALANEVTDPSKNYYNVFRLFQQHKTDADQTSWLARQAIIIGDTSSSKEIASAYILHLQKDSLLTSSNIAFMKEFTSSSKNEGFRLFYEKGKQVDSIMADDGYAEGLIQDILIKENVKPTLERSEKSKSIPDWNKLQVDIQTRFNKYYSDRVITASRASWALHHDNLREYTHYLVMYMDSFGTKTNNDLLASLTLNNYAWEIFQDGNDPYELNRALSWSGRAVMMYPIGNWMDTYANILYKLGRKGEALMWEGVASKTEPDNKDFQATLKKMNRDELPRLPN